MTKKKKLVWRTREGVCCKYGLMKSGRIVHEKGCPNKGDNVEPVDLRK